MTPILLDNMLSPVVLFFVFGLLAAVVGSGLSLPTALSETLTLFLLMAIGYKGGIALAEYGVPSGAWILMISGAALSALMPLGGYWLLRRLTPLAPYEAAVVAAHYGSVSVVTFMAAAAYLQLQAAESSGYMVAMLVIMEIPAVVTGIWLARRLLPIEVATGSDLPAVRPPLNVFFHGSVLLLLGSLVIGMVARGDSRDQLTDFLLSPLLGVLCLFLFDMGLKAGRKLGALRSAGTGFLLFGMLMPLLGGAIALGIAVVLRVSVADATLFAVLAASASYIVVPADMRMAVPQADAELGTSIAIGVTFPFNIIVGIPLFYALAAHLLAGS